MQSTHPNDVPTSFSFFPLLSKHVMMPSFGRSYLDSMAREAGAGTVTEVKEIGMIPNDRPNDATPSPIVLVGTMHTPGSPVGGQAPIASVGVFLGLFRIEDKNADLIVKVIGGNMGEEEKANFTVIVTSLHITDFGVFQRRIGT
jgi:hypothetical protein